MDRHDIPGVTAKDVAFAHQADLNVQDQFGCRGLTYWFDEARGIAFCLVEAPKKESVQAMHNKAHGLMPHQIIEVDAHLVESFLGRIEDLENVDHSKTFIDETAMRVLMATDLNESPLMESKFGIKKGIELFNVHNHIIRAQIKKYEGREVEYGGNGMLVSFTSISKAVHCALEIQKEFRYHNDLSPGESLHIAVGLNAGMPVTTNHDFFEQVVLLARWMCFLAGPGQIMVSSEVFEMVKREDISIFYDRTYIRILSPKDEHFLNVLMDTIERYWAESTFNVLDLCKETGLSKSQLNRKITTLTGHSPNDFIKEFRLKQALELLDKRKGNISEIAFETGFSSPSYFSKCFLKRFGILPSNFTTHIQ
jgi:AraC-like DNA-binding protein